MNCPLFLLRTVEVVCFPNPCRKSKVTCSALDLVCIIAPDDITLEGRHLYFSKCKCENPVWGLCLPRSPVVFWPHHINAGLRGQTENQVSLGNDSGNCCTGVFIDSMSPPEDTVCICPPVLKQLALDSQTQTSLCRMLHLGGSLQGSHTGSQLMLGNCML